MASTGQGILGSNMFAYCNNNPVNMSDSSGTLPHRKNMVAINDGAGGDIGPVGIISSDDWRDLDKHNNAPSNLIAYIMNDDESVVLEAEYFAFYKGVPVFRIDGNRSGSFGAIFLTRKTNSSNNPEDVVRHEYGHVQQLVQLGLVKYALCIGLPSWQEWGTGEYYSKPWEITADLYGGVQSRVHSQSAIDAGYEYLIASKLLGPIVWLFID